MEKKIAGYFLFDCCIQISILLTEESFIALEFSLFAEYSQKSSRKINFLPNLFLNFAAAVRDLAKKNRRWNAAVKRPLYQFGIYFLCLEM